MKGNPNSAQVYYRTVNKKGDEAVPNRILQLGLLSYFMANGWHIYCSTGSDFSILTKQDISSSELDKESWAFISGPLVLFMCYFIDEKVQNPVLAAVSLNMQDRLRFIGFSSQVVENLKKDIQIAWNKGLHVFVTLSFQRNSRRRNKRWRNRIKTKRKSLDRTRRRSCS